MCGHYVFVMQFPVFPGNNSLVRSLVQPGLPGSWFEIKPRLVLPDFRGKLGQKLPKKPGKVGFGKLEPEKPGNLGFTRLSG